MSGIQTDVFNDILQDYQNTPVVSFINPKPDELIPFKMAVHDALSLLVDSLLTDVPVIRLLILVKHTLEKDAYQLLHRVLEHYVDLLFSAENVNWNVEDVTTEEFERASIACFRRIISTLDIDYLTGIALEAIEMGETLISYSAWLLRNPTELESLVNSLIQTGGKIWHTFNQWAVVQAQVDPTMFDQMVEPLTDNMEKTKKLATFKFLFLEQRGILPFFLESLRGMNNGILMKIDHVMTAHIIAWDVNDSFLARLTWDDTVPFPLEDADLKMRFMKLLGSDAVKKLNTWWETAEVRIDNLTSVVTPVWRYDDTTRKWVRPDYSAAEAKRAELFAFGQEIQATLMDQASLRSYQFKIEDVLQKLNSVFDPVMIHELYIHLSTVDQLVSDLVRNVVLSDELKNVVDWFLTNFSAPEVLSAPIDLGKKIWSTELPKNWSNVYFHAVKDFAHVVKQIRQCEEICQAKF